MPQKNCKIAYQEYQGYGQESQSDIRLDRQGDKGQVSEDTGAEPDPDIDTCYEDERRAIQKQAAGIASIAEGFTSPTSDGLKSLVRGIGETQQNAQGKINGYRFSRASERYRQASDFTDKIHNRLYVYFGLRPGLAKGIVARR